MLPRWMARTSRADLIWGLVAFALLQLGLALAVEDWLPQFRDPNYACRAARLKQRTATAPGAFAVVMMGSSRVEDAFVSTALERPAAQSLGAPVIVFNFGVPGAGPVANLLNLQRLRAQGSKPGLLFIEVWPAEMSDTSPEVGMLPADRLERHEVAFVQRYGFPASLAHDWWTCFLVPAYGHRYAILSQLLPAVVPPATRLDWGLHIDDCGWGHPMTRAVTAQDRAKAIARDRPRVAAELAQFGLGTAARAALRDLLELCRQEGIQAALIWMPETSTYRSCYPPPALAQVYGYLDELSRQYDVPLVDARAWVPDDYFFDSHHLLVSGAEWFSKRFGEDVLLPALARLRQGEPAFRRIDTTAANAAGR
jgi:hypothetical protein